MNIRIASSIMIVITAVILIFTLNGTAYADDAVAYGTPQVFKMTFMGFYMHESSAGDEDFITIRERTDAVEIDLANADAGTIAQTLTGTKSPPPGHYDSTEYEVSATFTYQGAILYDEDIYYTISGGAEETGDYDSLDDFYADPPDDYAERTYKIPDYTDDIIEGEQDEDLTVGAEGTYDENLYVDLSQAMELVWTGPSGGWQVFPGKPQISGDPL